MCWSLQHPPPRLPRSGTEVSFGGSVVCLGNPGFPIFLGLWVERRRMRPHPLPQTTTAKSECPEPAVSGLFWGRGLLACCPVSRLSPSRPSCSCGQRHAGTYVLASGWVPVRPCPARLHVRPPPPPSRKGAVDIDGGEPEPEWWEDAGSEMNPEPAKGETEARVLLPQAWHPPALHRHRVGGRVGCSRQGAEVFWPCGVLAPSVPAHSPGETQSSGLRA